MYLDYFKMTGMPFSLQPDTDFFYNGVTYREALNVLLVAIRSGEGFVKVTGEVGTGKTMLCRRLLNALGDGYVTAYLPNPFLTPNELRMALADELGLDIDNITWGNRGTYRLMKTITERLIEITTSGKQVIVCLDECQAMPPETLEALRLFSNIETETKKLLQVVLFGQPEFDERLNKQCNRQFKQRISFSYKLQPVDKGHLSDYVNFRLQVSGYRGGELFNNKCIKLIYRYTQGVPRLINTLCHKSLMLAYGKGRLCVAGSDIKQAMADINESEPAFSSIRWFIAAALGLMGMALSAWGVLS